MLSASKDETALGKGISLSVEIDFDLPVSFKHTELPREELAIKIANHFLKCTNLPGDKFICM